MTDSATTGSATTGTSDPATHAEQRAQELRDAKYPSHDDIPLECDLVMKGGITSGVVYPLAACELAKTHRFVNIGGSSAGAIAACVVAAAECGRDKKGFNLLAALPSAIGSDLPSLFKSGPHTKTAHAALMAAIDSKSTGSTRLQKVVRTLARAQRTKLLRGLGLAVVVAVVAGLLLAGVPDDAVSIARFVVIAVVSAALVFGVTLVLAMVAEARATMDGLVAQGFGIVVGSDGPDAVTKTTASNAGPGALTDWLAMQIDGLAGVDRPLLVGDLEDAGINLQVLTTDLTMGRPMTFPFADEKTFMFDPVELRAYFPGAVVDAMVDGQEPVRGADVGAPEIELESAEGRALYWMPPAKGVPVVLAARISLSFPGLISAVPLYMLDNSPANHSAWTAVRCWFSDGGITSNFPIHFFDSLWPSRPTFALDLHAYPSDEPNEDVYYSATQPVRSQPSRIATLPGFFSSILNTMQYWADNAQSALPGYRDRVVEVHLHPNEGGMNLEMDAATVAIVAEKGRHAAEALLDGFDFDRHRWVRFLISMGRLQEAVTTMDSRYGPSAIGRHDGMRDVIDRAPELAPSDGTDATADPLNWHDWAVKAKTRTELLLEFGIWTEPDFIASAPDPVPVLRITPKF